MADLFNVEHGLWNVITSHGRVSTSFVATNAMMKTLNQATRISVQRNGQVFKFDYGTNGDYILTAIYGHNANMNIIPNENVWHILFVPNTPENHRRLSNGKR